MVVSPATVARLPLYLRALSTLVDREIDTVSSGDLAEAAGVTGAQVRKDLSQLGSYGTRGVGYHVVSLADEISRELGLTS
ncbi:MAG: redox-sensing transcriptional repressor, partial [Frankiaceae bacterium]|nr:redox-sensing transcriptional repressor [Frankiaceae bacterium]